MTILYGIPNCDTIKRARAWLREHGVEHDFHDYKKAGVDPATLDGWIARSGWEALLNRAGTTFRGLPDVEKTALDRDRAAALMQAHPSLIRRPVLVADDTLEIGFTPERYAAIFA